MRKAWLGVLAACALPMSSGAAAGVANVHITESKKARYSFEAWPKGAAEPIRFVSAIYLKDSASYVHLDEGLFRAGEESGIRYTADFDSLRAARYVPRGTVLPAPMVWYKAAVAGQRWAFPRLTGKVTLYSSQPERSSYVFMDTGAGIESYSEAAVRTKISSNPAAKKWLRQEKTGKCVAWTMAAVGGGLAVAGLGATIAEVGGTTSNAVALVGIGIAAASWIPHLSVQGKYERAIRAYNEDVPAN